MRDLERAEQERRRVLKLLGSSALLMPLAGLGACSGEKPPAPAAEAPPEPAPEPMPAPEPSEPAVAQQAAAQADLVPLTEDNEQAAALGYVQDATRADAAKYPQYTAGQACTNCVLYQGGDAPSGACSIFPGKAVKATGWCSVYTAKG